MFSLLLELREDAFMDFNILPRPKVNGLIQGVGLLECIEVPDFDDLAHLRHLEVDRDGHVADQVESLAIQQA
jgi:hypothetical protein